MDVQPFDLNKVPSPWKPILIREVEKLKKRPDVVAIGVAGSLAQEDTWSHSDIDIEVVLRGDHEFTVLTTEQELSVDFGLFGENNVNRIPYETRPVYDPHGILSRELASRDLNEVLSRGLLDSLNASRDYLERAEEALGVDARSGLAFLHLYAWSLAELLTVAAGDNRTVKRRCSRLERAVARHNREDFLNRCGQLFGFPKTLQHSRELLSQLEEGYREVWGFFRHKPLHSGPVYMIQQPDSELWFRNRIEPLYQEDPRDLVWLVYLEFPFVTRFLFKNLTDHERLPPDMFVESEVFPETPREWVSRHIKCLELFDTGSAERMLAVAEELIADAAEFVDEELYLR